MATDATLMPFFMVGNSLRPQRAEAGAEGLSATDPVAMCQQLIGNSELCPDSGPRHVQADAVKMFFTAYNRHYIK